MIRVLTFLLWRVGVANAAASYTLNPELASRAIALVLAEEAREETL